MTRLMGRSGAALAAFFFAAEARATAVDFAWVTGTQYQHGLTYGATVNAGVSAPVALTVTRRRIYQIPGMTGSSTYWTLLPNAERLPMGLGNAAVTVAGDWIYVIGGRRANDYSACTGSVSRTVRTVYYARLNNDGSLGEKPCGLLPSPPCWRESAYEVGQLPGEPDGVPLWNHGAVSVRNARGLYRIYVVGGSTSGDPTYVGGQEAVSKVYSALQNPFTGDLGPWDQEIPLSVAVTGHGLAYAGGALFTFGGSFNEITGMGKKLVQRADVKIMQPGSTGPPLTLRGSENALLWDIIPDMPPGAPPSTYNLCMEISVCALCEGLCPDIADDSQCRAQVGWTFMNSMSAMRSLMFLGAAYKRSWSSSCNHYTGAGVGYLDDCNEPQWKLIAGAPGGCTPGGAGTVHDDVLLVVGGGPESGAQTYNALFNPAGAPGLIRDPATPDSMDVMPPPPDKSQLLLRGANVKGFPEVEAFSERAMYGTLVTWKDYAFLPGFVGNAWLACNRVYRATLPPSIWFANAFTGAGYYISPPYDLKKLAKGYWEGQGEPPDMWVLDKVSWKFDKTGPAGDDWAMVRYRVAGEDGDWGYEGCAGGWSPRVPSGGNTPGAPGSYEYSSVVPDNDPLYQPVFQKPIRYIQFEVSLYNDNTNDSPVPTLPVFREFRISYSPAGAETLESPVKGDAELYPIPASERLTVRFMIVEEGGVVEIRIYNSAGRLAFDEEFRYLNGGVKRENLDVSVFANGVYIMVMESKGSLGGPAFTSETDRPGEPPREKVKRKFVIRR